MTIITILVLILLILLLIILIIIVVERFAGEVDELVKAGDKIASVRKPWQEVDLAKTLL